MSNIQAHRGGYVPPMNINSRNDGGGPGGGGMFFGGQQEPEEDAFTSSGEKEKDPSENPFGQLTFFTPLLSLVSGAVGALKQWKTALAGQLYKNYPKE